MKSNVRDQNEDQVEPAGGVAVAGGSRRHASSAHVERVDDPPAAIAGQGLVTLSQAIAGIAAPVGQDETINDDRGSIGEIGGVTTHANRLARPRMDPKERHIRCPHWPTRPARG